LTIIAIASPFFFGTMNIRFSMSLADSEEGRSSGEAEDDNKRADALRGAGVGGR
jgi:hypothetical protein